MVGLVATVSGIAVNLPWWTVGAESFGLVTSCDAEDVGDRDIGGQRTKRWGTAIDQHRNECTGQIGYGSLSINQSESVCLRPMAMRPSPFNSIRLMP